MNVSKTTPEELEALAWEYVQECMNYTKEHPTASGKTVQILERQIPTVSYFLMIWLPTKYEKKICRRTYYNWLRSECEDKMHTIKQIEGYMRSLAENIVANEGRGVFYAKNRLKMSDRPMLAPCDLDPTTGELIKAEQSATELEQFNFVVTGMEIR